jgi:two-component system, NarL family, nitrate/nitrite response regulator NarL
LSKSHPTLIVENDNLVREGVRLLLEKTSFEPHTIAIDDSPDFDITPEIMILFGKEGTALGEHVQHYKQIFPDSKVVVLINNGDLEKLAGAMDAGANAVLLTSISSEGLIKALNAVVTENIFVMDSRIWPAGTSAADLLSNDGADVDGGTRLNQNLSMREVEILERILEGDSNKQIARHLDIAEATVKAHMKTVLRKIGVNNRTQAAIWAMNNGLNQQPMPSDEMEIDPEPAANELHHPVLQ